MISAEIIKRSMYGSKTNGLLKESVSTKGRAQIPTDFLEGNLKVVPLDLEKCICFLK